MSEYSYYQNINKSNTCVKQTAWTLNLISYKVKGRTSAPRLIPFLQTAEISCFAQPLGCAFLSFMVKNKAGVLFPFKEVFPIPKDATLF